MQQELVKLLKNDFINRRDKNASYSLRAFARDLGIGPTSLSDFFQGKRLLSPRNAKAVCERLMLSPIEQDRVLGQKEKPKDGNERIFIQEEKLRLISEWYYMAILNIAHTENNNSQVDHISARLGVGTPEIEQALNDLENLGLIKRKDGKLIRTKNPIGTTQDIPSAAIKKMHRSLLTKALATLDATHVREREFGATVMAINPKKLPQAKALLHEFRDKLALCLEKGPRKKVYVFNFQLFNLES